MSRFERIIEALEKSGVRYVIVGGLAVLLQGYARLTVDIDVVLDLRAPDVAGALDALTGLGLKPSVPVEARQFADAQTRATWIADKGMMVFSMHDPDDPTIHIDLFVEDPIPFEELYGRSEVVPIGSTQARIASIEDLLTMKRAAGRPKDLEDVRELERLLRSRNDER